MHHNRSKVQTLGSKVFSRSLKTSKILMCLKFVKVTNTSFSWVIIEFIIKKRLLSKNIDADISECVQLSESFLKPNCPLLFQKKLVKVMPSGSLCCCFYSCRSDVVVGVVDVISTLISIPERYIY